MDIQKEIESAATRLIESGKIEKTIEAVLEETIKQGITQALKSYSDFGKQIEEAIKKAVNISNVDFPDYNKLVSTWVMDIANRSMIQVGKAQIEANLKEFFQPLEKDTWKASEIVEKFIKSIREDVPGDNGEITCIVETNENDSLTSLRKYWAIYLDEDRNIQKYKCKIQIHIKEDGVWRVMIDGEDSREMKFPSIYGFKDFIFKLYSTKAKIINDEHNISTEYGYED